MNKYYKAVAAAQLLLSAVHVQAGMGTIANTFGLLPGDVGRRATVSFGMRA